jgi:hypothetical protein
MQQLSEKSGATHSLRQLRESAKMAEAMSGRDELLAKVLTPELFARSQQTLAESRAMLAEFLDNCRRVDETLRRILGNKSDESGGAPSALFQNGLRGN